MNAIDKLKAENVILKARLDAIFGITEIEIYQAIVGMGNSEENVKLLIAEKGR